MSNTHPRVLRQDVIDVVSDDPGMAAEVDRRWVNDPELTVGNRIRLMTDLYVEVLREHGYEVRGR
jgi:hypothetical protein